MAEKILRDRIRSFITEPLGPQERAEISYSLCDFFSPGNRGERLAALIPGGGA